MMNRYVIALPTWYVAELSMGWVDPQVGLGQVWSRFFGFWWVGLGLLQQKY